MFRYVHFDPKNVTTIIFLISYYLNSIPARGRLHPFDPNYHYYSVDQAAKNMASRGLRVVAFAKGRTLVDLEFIGIIGLHDPPRPGHCQHGLLEND